LVIWPSPDGIGQDAAFTFHISCEQQPDFEVQFFPAQEANFKETKCVRDYAPEVFIIIVPPETSSSSSSGTAV